VPPAAAEEPAPEVPVAPGDGDEEQEESGSKRRGAKGSREIRIRTNRALPRGRCATKTGRALSCSSMFTSGDWTGGNVRGAPVRIHWSAPLGAIVFTGFSLSPILWAGFVLLVLLHELGHAALVRRFGYQVTAVRVHAFGGDCQWSGDPTRAEDAAVAWGGVLAQAVVWVAATVTLLVVGWPSSAVLSALAFTFTSTNARMILFNLLPIPPLDGHRAWPLLPMLWQARKEQRMYRRDRAARRQERNREVEREKARAATEKRAAAEKEVSTLGAEDDRPAPIPPEVRAVLDRIAKEAAAALRTKRGRDD
jgi:stage IV sporulation protein FB